MSFLLVSLAVDFRILANSATNKKNDGPIGAAAGAREVLLPDWPQGKGGCWSSVKRRPVASSPGRKCAPHLGVFTRADRRSLATAHWRPPCMASVLSKYRA